MHTDKKGCTQMARSHGHWVGREPMSVQPASACILLIRVYLRFLFLCRSAHARDRRSRDQEPRLCVRSG
jgi:hypothetical protein